MSVKERLAPGLLVTKAAASLPQNADVNLFTISGGAVLVTGLIGVVTTAIGATATTLRVGTSPGGSNIIIASGVITSAVVGTLYIPTTGVAGSSGNPIIGQAPFITVAEPNLLAPFYTAQANITWGANSANTGQMRWYLWYEPLDLSAVVS